MAVTEHEREQIETLARLVRHGIEALYEGDGDKTTRDATLANLDQLVARALRVDAS